MVPPARYRAADLPRVPCHGARRVGLPGTFSLGGVGLDSVTDNQGTFYSEEGNDFVGFNNGIIYGGPDDDGVASGIPP
jgi:hypothetical protein